jgi:hypothetical protein
LVTYWATRGTIYYIAYPSVSGEDRSALIG